jgi:chromosomal replication initiator protein
MPRPALTFARFVAVPENRAAWLAVQDVATCIASSRTRRHHNPLLVHGPSGTGKTHLIRALIGDVTQRSPDLAVNELSAVDLVHTATPTLFGTAATETRHDVVESTHHCDLLIVEDLQHLPLYVVETLVAMIDYLQARQRQMVFTANAGPQQMQHRGQRFPTRLSNRLAGGLVVALQPLGPKSRLALLQDKAQRRQLAVGSEVLAWLAQHVAGGGRQLDGAIGQLETMAKMQREPLAVETVARHFREQVEASRVTVDRIAAQVGSYFQIGPGQLLSRRRYRNVLLPRQVGMYLARQLTALSLDQIGAYFGGRDHSTVLHACHKIEEALEQDAGLSGAVRQLHAELA